MAESLTFSVDGVEVPSLFTDLGEFVYQGDSGRNLLGMDVALNRSVGTDGSRLVEASLPSREISIQFSLVSDGLPETARAAERMLMGAVARTKLTPLVFSDQAGSYQAIMSAASVKATGEGWCTGEIVFTCPKPFLYGAAVLDALVVDGAYVAGTNYFVEPQFEVEMAAAAPAGFVLTVNGETFEYSAALQSAQVVVVNSEARETRLGGVLKVAEIDGVYPVLEAQNSVSLSVPGSVKVSYQERWA